MSRYKLIAPNGKEVFGNIIEVGRLGTKSPQMEIFVVEGRRITPFEQRIRGWKMPFQTLLQWAYRGECIRELLYKGNPFLARTPMERPFGSYIPIPLGTRR